MKEDVNDHSAPSVNEVWHAISVSHFRRFSVISEIIWSLWIEDVVRRTTGIRLSDNKRFILRADAPGH